MLVDWIYEYIGQDAGRDPACSGKPFEMVDGKGDFFSPSFDRGTPYGYNMDCQWIIKLAGKGLLAVSFKEFDLQYSKDCREDSLSIFDGNSLDQYRGSWCGNSGPGIIVADNQKAHLKFQFRTNADNRGTWVTFRPYYLAKLIFDFPSFYNFDKYFIWLNFWLKSEV